MGWLVVMRVSAFISGPPGQGNAGRVCGCLSDSGKARNAPGGVRDSSWLDVHRLQRREAVEAHRRIGRRVGAGALDQHLVADLEAYWELVRLPPVQHTGRVARRPGEHARAKLVAVPRCLDRVADRLVHRLGETAEL